MDKVRCYMLHHRWPPACRKVWMSKCWSALKQNKDISLLMLPGSKYIRSQILHIFITHFINLYQNLTPYSYSCRDRSWDYTVMVYLCDIVPHAPCLLVRMLRIFCFSWLAVTWSLCLAALMRWSHIFSSSLRSAAYCAQLDWRRRGRGKLNKDQKQ